MYNCVHSALTADLLSRTVGKKIISKGTGHSYGQANFHQADTCQVTFPFSITHPLLGLKDWVFDSPIWFNKLPPSKAPGVGADVDVKSPVNVWEWVDINQIDYLFSIHQLL